MTTASAADLAYQEFILPQVSRTFALTIPELPAALETVVANAYLLCRIADTIEDDPLLDSDSKLRYMGDFLAALDGSGDAQRFARTVAARLAPTTAQAERDLIAHTASVIAVTGSFPAAQRQIVERCVRIMGQGMPEFQHHKSPDGLAGLEELDRYCYFVAGVVGEMLTELFCEHSPRLAAVGGELRARAVSFGQGLQMTNILKDVWEDRNRKPAGCPAVFSTTWTSPSRRLSGIATPGNCSRASGGSSASPMRTLPRRSNTHC